MQTFSNMRRNSFNKDILKAIILFAGLCIYESIASMLVFLPPLIGICLILFIRFDQSDNFYSFLAVICAVIFIEIENNIPLGFLLAVFLFLSLLVIPKIQVILNTPKMLKVAYVVLAYLSYYFTIEILDLIVGVNFSCSFLMILYFIVLEIIVAIFL